MLKFLKIARFCTFARFEKHTFVYQKKCINKILRKNVLLKYTKTYFFVLKKALV